MLIVPGLRDHVPEHWQTLLQAELERDGTKVACVPRRTNDKLSCALWIEAIDDSYRGSATAASCSWRTVAA